MFVDAWGGVGAAAGAEGELAVFEVADAGDDDAVSAAMGAGEFTGRASDVTSIRAGWAIRAGHPLESSPSDCPDRPVVGGNHETSQRVVDAIFRALADPDRLAMTGWSAGGLLFQHLPEGEEGRDRLHTRLDHPDWDHVAVLAGCDASATPAVARLLDDWVVPMARRIAVRINGQTGVGLGIGAQTNRRADPIS